MAPEPKPATGFRFGDLPTELRHLIWDIAARRKAEDLVIFCRNDYTINPTQQLVSAMLSATRESRFCALRVFHLHLDLPNNGKVHVNLELGTLAGNEDLIRSYMTVTWFRNGERKTFLPTSPGPWRRALTPISGIIPVEERQKARRFAVIHLVYGPAHQGLLQSSFPAGKTTFRPAANSAQQKIFFFNLAAQASNALRHIFHDLNTMGWRELNEKLPGQITEWTAEDSDQ